jgi:hypothetical protein
MSKGRKSVQGAEHGTPPKKKGSDSQNKGQKVTVLLEPSADLLPAAQVNPSEQLQLPDGLPNEPTQDQPEADVQKADDSEPTKKSNSVDDMSGDELKTYAAKVGVSQRDIDGLTEDRLRQNCKARIFSAMEDD